MGENIINGDKILSNLIWRFAERCGAQFVTFVVSIILARILDPVAYGIVAIMTVFTSIIQVFVDSGLGNALIQKKNADTLDFSTVFYTNIVFCVILYFVLFAVSPAIANFYGLADLTKYIRVMGIVIIISGVKNVQQAYVSCHMLFRTFFFSTLIGTAGAAIIGISLACMGYGIWALILQNIFNTLLDTIILWITVKWRPVKKFSWKRLKSLYSYGWKLLLSSLLNSVYENIRQLIIGKVYTSESLAFYNRGYQFPHLVVNNINTSIDSVLFPAMAASQDDYREVRNLTRRSIQVSSYVMWPLMIGLAAVANNLIHIILTDKWMQCVPYIRIFCIALAFQPIQTANLNAIKALGRSDLYFKMEILKKSIGMTIVLFSMNFGVLAIAYGTLFYSFVAQIINSWPNRKLLNYKYLEQLKDILPYIAMSALMGATVLLVGLLHINVFIIFLLQIITGILVYLFLSIIFRIEVFTVILTKIVLFFTKSKESSI